jgi:hypothetical protein
MNQRNSILLTRITNWAIGDPQRKEPYYIAIANARVGTPVDVIVKSDKYPNVEGISLTKVSETQYKTTILPTEPGFKEIIGKGYAVNYQTEYQDLGMSQRLEPVMTLSGGKMFSPTESSEIAKFVKAATSRTITERTTIIWPFVLAAGILFLAEVLIRRVREYNLNK